MTPDEMVTRWRRVEAAMADASAGITRAQEALAGVAVDAREMARAQPGPHDPEASAFDDLLGVRTQVERAGISLERLRQLATLRAHVLST